MFYVDQLLSKTGPLAKVWLAANLERKLSKSQVLQSDIGKDINVILNENNAPMALRLHGNLMLGVVRIYGKKAKYLQDDCHEALLKIRVEHDMVNRRFCLCNKVNSGLRVPIRSQLCLYSRLSQVRLFVHSPSIGMRDDEVRGGREFIPYASTVDPFLCFSLDEERFGVIVHVSKHIHVYVDRALSARKWLWRLSCAHRCRVKV